MLRDFISSLFKGPEPPYKPATPYCSPAAEFEQRTGLSGISRQWIMPRNLSYATTEESLERDTRILVFPKDHPNRPRSPHTDYLDAQKRMSAFYDQLVELNPQLKTIAHARENPRIMIDVIYGATSQFNFNDIVYFTSTNEVSRNNNTALLRKENILAIRAGADITWLPSDQTLADIERQMDNHPLYRGIRVKEVPELEKFKFGSGYARSPASIKHTPGGLRYG